MKPVKNSGILTGIIITTILYSCAGSKHTHQATTGTFTKTPVTIDGDNSEWPSPYPYYDTKARLSYAVANDKDYLYITVKTGDEVIKRKIMRGGLKTWIDPTGKKEQVISINYPLKQSGPPSMENNGRPSGDHYDRPQQGMSDSGFHRKPLVIVLGSELTLDGFASGNGTFSINKATPGGITVSMKSNDYNELVWEAAIPLKAIYPALSGAVSGQPLSICFETSSMPMPARDGDHRGGGNGGGGGMRMGGGGGGMSMGGGGMGMGHGGGGRGGGGGGMRQGPGNGGEDMEDLLKATKTWIKTGIALPQ